MLLCTVGPFLITCGKERTIFLTVDEASGNVQASENYYKATRFYIVRCDEHSNYFNITCDAPSVADDIIQRRRYYNSAESNVPGIPMYLTAPVNWWGQTSNNQRPKMVMSGKADMARMALHSRRHKTFQPVNLTEWINEKEVYFINCREPALRGLKRSSYLCVKKKSKTSKECKSDVKKEMTSEYVVECESDIKKNDDRGVFMLFRLLKVKLDSELLRIIFRFVLNNMVYFIGRGVRENDDSKQIEMDDPLLVDRKKYATRKVVLKVSSRYLSSFIIIMVLSFLSPKGA
jgi:hypothetical protein